MRKVCAPVYHPSRYDALVLRVDQVGGAACHTGKRNCFFRRIDGGKIEDVGTQVFDPNEVYKK